MNLNFFEIFPINSAIQTLAQTLGIGIVVVDPNLRILQTAGPVDQMFDLQSTLDQTLERGTEEKVQNRWIDLLRRALTEEPKTEFIEVQYKKGPSRKLYNLSFFPAQDDTSKIAGALVLAVDLTSSSFPGSHTERSERFMSIGKIAGRVAHELNNPLDGILRYINLSLRVLDLNQPDKAKDYLQHCRTGLQRMTQILGELLEFSRSSHRAFEQLTLDRLIEDAVHTLDNRLENIQVSFQRQYNGPCLAVRSDSMFQVFCNLIKNAADAMDGAGRLDIRLSRTDQLWQITFQDSGPGFDPDSKDDLFQPFYTTKPFGRGTGLGLAICKDIIEKFGGTIDAQNAPEGGSIFTIILSAAARKEIESAKESSHE